MKRNRRPKQFLQEHSLSLPTLGVVILWITLYRVSDPSTHPGSSSGCHCGLDRSVDDGCHDQAPIRKGIAREQAAEGQSTIACDGIPPRAFTNFVSCGDGRRLGICVQSMNPDSKWGQVVGNIVLEWTQVLGLVLMTKRLIEVGSKER